MNDDNYAAFTELQAQIKQAGLSSKLARVLLQETRPWKWEVEIYEDRIIGLNLEGISREPFEDEFFELPAMESLEHLNLSWTALENLPETIACLSNLQELMLRGNRLSVLPESIGNLSNLRFL